MLELFQIYFNGWRLKQKKQRKERERQEDLHYSGYGDFGQ